MPIKEYTTKNGKKVRQGKSFDDGDQQYPKNWLENASSQDLEDREITVKTLPDKKARPLTPKEDAENNLINNERDNKIMNIVDDLYDSMKLAGVDVDTYIKKSTKDALAKSKSDSIKAGR